MGDPTNGELAIMLGNLDDKMLSTQESNEKAHKAILEQTTKTNGRVSFLEKMAWTTSGAVAVLMVIVIQLIIPWIKTILK